jgi:hypothetical protein
MADEESRKSLKKALGDFAIKQSKRAPTIEELLFRVIDQVRILNGIGQLNARFKEMLKDDKLKLSLAEKLEALGADQREEFMSMSPEEKIEFLMPPARPPARAPAPSPGGYTQSDPFTKRESDLIEELRINEERARRGPPEFLDQYRTEWNATLAILRRSIENRGINPDELGIPKHRSKGSGKPRKCKKCGLPKRI